MRLCIVHWNLPLHSTDIPPHQQLIGIRQFKWHMAWLNGTEVSASGWGSGGLRFQSHPRLNFQSCSRYLLNQLGSKAASESTFKKLNTCGVSNNRLYFNDKEFFRFYFDINRSFIEKIYLWSIYWVYIWKIGCILAEKYNRRWYFGTGARTISWIPGQCIWYVFYHDQHLFWNHQFL